MGVMQDDGEIEITEHDVIIYALKTVGMIKERDCPSCGHHQSTVNISVVETTQLPNKTGETPVPWKYIAISCVICGKTDFYDYATVLSRADKLKKQEPPTLDKS